MTVLNDNERIHLSTYRNYINLIHQYTQLRDDVNLTAAQRARADERRNECIDKAVIQAQWFHNRGMNADALLEEYPYDE